ncbi:MAG: flagellar hook-basal body complex protein FliE [Deltaproteobacteria bacterium]|nr:flagellar hook-basal body complex protein FliE [Deltaproteobacteria bacterium]
MNDISIQNNTESPPGVNSTNKRAPQTESTSFGKILTDSLDQVSRLQHESNENIQDLVSGKHTNIHQTMIAAEKSSVAFELLMQIRNKTIAAYDKIMRMPV